MSAVRGLREAIARLDRLAVPDALAAQTAEAAAAVERNVIESLSHPPGSEHETPWLENGSLRNSVGYDAQGTDAVIGSSSDVAVYQELGTPNIPPRPFLGSAAATMAGDLVTTMAANLARWLAER
ncbi:MAG: hypothetical protein JSR21_00060 [Proteobacteria bacterium]|nr:hypothetical protein [Pseudomonadota bacterium]